MVGQRASSYRKPACDRAALVARQVRVVPTEIREAAAMGAPSRRLSTKAELVADHTEEAPREREDLKAGATPEPGRPIHTRPASE